MEQNMNLNDMGRIWLSRKILHWQHFGQPSYLTVFITLLLVANHRDQWWKGVKVNRGETVISVKSLCKLCNLSCATVVKVLKGLEKSGEIERTRLFRNTLKTRILHYIDYQASSKVKIKNFTSNVLTSKNKQDIYSNISSSSSNNIYIIDPEKILKKMLESGAMVEQFCMKEHITVEQFKQLGEEVINEWKLTGKEHSSEKETRQHLLNHIRIKISKRQLASDDMDARLRPLVDACKRLVDAGYPVNKVREFYLNWTQPATDHSGRLLFEIVKAFDAETRFLDWFKGNKFNFNSKQS